MRRFVSYAILAGLVAIVTGCAPSSVFVATPVGTMEQATTFQPPKGMSGIYVIREAGIVGAAVPWRVDLDLQTLAELRQRNCVYAAVAPGDHNLRAIYQEGGQTFRTEADKNYFFLMQVSFTGYLKVLSEFEGREYVNSYKSK